MFINREESTGCMVILEAPFQVFWNKNKKEPKEMPSCLITHLVVVFSRQLEILVTALWLTTYLLTIFNFHTFFSAQYNFCFKLFQVYNVSFI